MPIEVAKCWEWLPLWKWELLFTVSLLVFKFFLKLRALRCPGMQENNIKKWEKIIQDVNEKFTKEIGMI